MAPIPGRRQNRAAGAVTWILALALSLLPAACDRSEQLSGLYSETGGPGVLEFKKDRVYVTTLLGMTFVAPYEIDGDRVIIKGAGGSQVYTLHGDTLDGGAGRKFVKSPSDPRTRGPDGAHR